mgnify:FL=1
MSGLPKRANIAYLGFSGTRSGDNLVVTKRLPTVAASFDYPILEGDVITKIDGKPLKEYVDENLLKTRHLGQTESNYTYHLNRIFTRTSIYQPMPEGENPVATITIDRGGIEEDVVLPWIVKDVYTFEQEQARAQTNSNPFMDTDSKPNGDAVDGLAKFASKYFRVGHNMANTEVLKKYLKLAVDFGLSEKPADLNKVLVERNKLRWETMMVVNNDMTWDIAEAKPTNEALQADPLIGLRQERYVESGPNIIPIKGSFLMPAYVKIAKTKTGERKAVGYIRIESFSLPANADAELRTTLSAMNTIGQTFTDKNVEDIVLDLIDNGGGSLVAGLRLAQALSAEKIEMPAMQFGLNETCLLYTSPSPRDNR